MKIYIFSKISSWLGQFPEDMTFVIEAENLAKAASVLATRLCVNELDFDDWQIAVVPIGKEQIIVSF